MSKTKLTITKVGDMETIQLVTDVVIEHQSSFQMLKKLCELLMDGRLDGSMMNKKSSLSLLQDIRGEAEAMLRLLP